MAWWGTTAAAAVVLLLVAFSLPPRTIRLGAPTWRPGGTVLRGAFHIHTTRSDGSGTPDEVAAAAARAGLQFIVLTDHGDGTRPPDPPRYRSGVLCLDAVEISTTGGHYAAIGIPQSPYPLGGEPRDVVEDVARLGGFGIVTHPDSIRGELRWAGWDQPFDAVEWLNADSEWRDAHWGRLIRSVVAYPFRGPEALAAMLERRAGLDRWDRVSRGRPVPAFAGNDIHARLHVGGKTDPDEGWTLARWPTYEDSFKSFSLHVTVPHAPSRDAAKDGEMLVDALRQGRLHTVVDGWAAPAFFEFTAHLAGQTHGEGAEVVSGREPVVLRVRANNLVDGRLVLFRDGVEVDRVKTAELVYATSRPGTYRAEAWLKDAPKGRPFPWIASNAITLRTTPEATQAVPAPAPPVDDQVVLSLGESSQWQLESDGRSKVQMAGERSRPTLEFELAGGAPRGQYVALSHPVDLKGASHARLRISSDRPMRVSLQLRAPGGGREGQRWQRSLYTSPEARDVVVPFASLTPAGPVTQSSVPSASVSAVLLVVDTTHTSPGTSGRLTLGQLRFLR